MNKKILMTITFLCVSIASTLAAADYKGKRYVGVQYAIAKYSEANLDEIAPALVVARLGEYFSDNFALEVRVGSGVKDADFTTVNATLDVDWLVGLYGVNHFNFNETTTGYGLAGVTRTKATTSDFVDSEADYDTGLSFGVGVDVEVSDTVDINVEYTEYLHGSDFVFSALNFGAVYSF